MDRKAFLRRYPRLDGPAFTTFMLAVVIFGTVFVVIAPAVLS